MYKKDEFKVGDWVKITELHGAYKKQITGETTTLWKVGNMRFRKSDGVALGGDMRSMAYISAWTEEDQKQVMEQVRLCKIKKVLNTIGLLDPKEISDQEMRSLTSVVLNHTKE